MTLFVSRNEAIGVVQRNRKNLVHMRNARRRGENVHEVTNLVNCLLGMVVFPWERHVLEDMQETRMDSLVADGWPKWKITLDNYTHKTDTLGRLVEHLRNASAHGRVRFDGVGKGSGRLSADSSEPSQVVVIVEDLPDGAEAIRWEAQIGGDDLYSFCLRLADYVEDRLG
jgi:hypothetical protein